jgi:hypothetical protein
MCSKREYNRSTGAWEESFEVLSEIHKPTVPAPPCVSVCRACRVVCAVPWLGWLSGGRVVVRQVPAERARIEKEGGFIIGGRVGGLSISRSFGDRVPPPLFFFVRSSFFVRSFFFSPVTATRRT